jgi:CRP/FNR family transcriptional regulator, cyclic AMP receptor protein
VIIEWLGWAAAAMTLLTFSMKAMLPLRLVAIWSNLLFIAYGGISVYALDNNFAQPVLALHGVLLPLNSLRLFQLLRMTRQIRAARLSMGLPDNIVSQLPTVSAPMGTILFRQGDPADRIYVLKSGCVRLEEIGTDMTAGELFGEVAFFNEGRARTLTARCLEPCELATLSEADFARLHYQNPAFGFFVLRLMARRLSQNGPPVET